MFELTSDSMVGKGFHRECYVHPDNERLCIKVVVNGDDKEVRREQAYYRFLQKRGIAWDMLPKFHGEVETNLGSGAVFDLIRDADGKVSRTLQQCIDTEYIAVLNQHGLQQSLQRLKEYLLAENIITMTIKPKNIAYQQRDNQSSVCILIDNIGNSDFIPISSYSRFFGRKKILRKWARFMSTYGLAMSHCVNVTRDSAPSESSGQQII